MTTKSQKQLDQEAKFRAAVAGGGTTKMAPPAAATPAKAEAEMAAFLRSAGKPPAEAVARVTTRLPQDLYNKLRDTAHAERTTINAIVIRVLEQHL